MTVNYSLKQIKQIENSISDSTVETINQIVIFVGHAHSGHSLIGALLDAHPQVCITNEVNIIKLLNDYKLRPVLFKKILLYNYFHNQKGWLNSEYEYNLKSGFQRSSKNIKVIGDKKAGGSTRIFYNNPTLIDSILKKFNSTIRFIFVDRKPLDVVAAYSYYMNEPPSDFHVNRYKENYETVKVIRSKVKKNQWLSINHNTFVQHPFEEMVKLYKFIDVDVSPHLQNIKKWVKIVRPNIKGKSSEIYINPNLRKSISEIRYND